MFEVVLVVLVVLLAAVLVVLLAGVGAFVWSLVRFGATLPERADELRDSLDAVRATDELRDTVADLHGDLADLLARVERAEAAAKWNTDLERRLWAEIHETSARVGAVDLRLQRAIQTISGTGIVHFPEDPEPR